jgi:hypothetical protein
MILSKRQVFAYVLRNTGYAGCLSAGRIEREAERLGVYDSQGDLVEYFSGERVRSWCLFGPDKAPIEGWEAISPEDAVAVRRAIAGFVPPI